MKGALRATRKRAAASTALEKLLPLPSRHGFYRTKRNESHWHLGHSHELKGLQSCTCNTLLSDCTEMEVAPKISKILSGKTLEHL